jgi:hypothetical protein
MNARHMVVSLTGRPLSGLQQTAAPETTDLLGGSAVGDDIDLACYWISEFGCG